MPTERTLILIKPDAVNRRLIGPIVTRIERKGLAILGMKMLRISPELSRAHYAEHLDKPFYPSLEAFITSGPVIAICAQGPGAIAVVRQMMGPTNAQEAPPGTIRGDYGLSLQRNLVHGSDGAESAGREIELYFRPEELVAGDANLSPWTAVSDER